jgi:hypothetical protein
MTVRSARLLKFQTPTQREFDGLYIWQNWTFIRVTVLQLPLFVLSTFSYMNGRFIEIL